MPEIQKGVNQMVKTNAMRMLDKTKIEYRTKEYEVDENDLSGSHAADMMAASLWMRSWI